MMASAQRTCVSCRAVRPQTELLRLVADDRGHLQVDPLRRRSGRGAYVCPLRTCLAAAARRGRVAQSLRRQIATQEPAALQAKVEQAVVDMIERLLTQAQGDGRVCQAGAVDGIDAVQASGRKVTVIEAGLKRQVAALSCQLTLLREEPPAGAGGTQK